MKKPILTKAAKADMDRLKMTKAARAAVVDYNVKKQEEKDKAAADVEKETADKIKADALMKAYNTDLELWRSKNLARNAVKALVETLLPDAPIQCATLMANYDGRVRELSRPQDTALELALVEQLAASHTRLQLVSMQCPLTIGSIEVNDYLDRHLEAAQRRFDKACLTLARVRRLALPILLMNIGHKQQVNIGFVSKAPKGKG